MQKRSVGMLSLDRERAGPQLLIFGQSVFLVSESRCLGIPEFFEALVPIELTNPTAGVRSPKKATPSPNERDVGLTRSIH